MTRFGVCLSAAIGALALALAAPTAATAFPVAQAVTDTITVGSGPAWVTVNPWTGAVYVADLVNGTVSVISR